MWKDIWSIELIRFFHVRLQTKVAPNKMVDMFARAIHYVLYLFKCYQFPTTCVILATSCRPIIAIVLF
uniref:Uncharacterized protein n=1 Tax=Daphnia galeata TaxID=27404 RepID=A0A8J2WH77_9CRUS|nr:unnamed protein product [Daphnia galeata]